MLGYLILIFLLYAGWRRFPWWTPFVAFGIAAPIILLQLTSINAWRTEAGLRSLRAEQLAVHLFAALVTSFACYWAGRGLSRLFRPSEKSSPQLAYSIDLTTGEHPLPSRQLTPEALIEETRHGPPAFPFRDNQAAFTYACKFLKCDLVQGAMLPALVQDGRSLFGTNDIVQLHTDGTQTAVVKIASTDGGFLALARTVGHGPTLRPGDFVGWLAGKHNPKLAEMAGDNRFGWVGLIVGTLRPEWKDGSWVGAERFETNAAS